MIVDRRGLGFAVAWASLTAASGCGTSGDMSLASESDASADADSAATTQSSRDAMSSGPGDAARSDAKGDDGSVVADAGTPMDSTDDGDAGEGFCNPAMTSPVTLYQATTDDYTGLAVDGAWVYFGGLPSGVLRVPKGGGAIEQVPQYDASKSVNFWRLAPSDIAVDADYVYWLVDGVGVARSPTSTSFSVTPPTLIAPVPTSATFNSSLRGLAVTATTVYFGNVDGQIVTFPIGSTTPPFTGGGDGFAYSIAADSSGVFWADSTVGIFRGTPDAGSPVLMAPGYPWNLTLDGASVYWSDNLGEVRAIHRQATDAGVAVVLAPMGVSPAGNGIAVDDQFVYWADETSQDAGSMASLRKAPKTGGDVRVLATGVAPIEIATDAACIYYIDSEHVLRVSKWAGDAP